MTENTPEATPRFEEEASYTPPPEAERKGWAVYDLTLGRYVDGVTKDKPSAKDAKASVPEGHDAELREV